MKRQKQRSSCAIRASSGAAASHLSLPRRPCITRSLTEKFRPRISRHFGPRISKSYLFEDHNLIESGGIVGGTEIRSWRSYDFRNPIGAGDVEIMPRANREDCRVAYPQ